MGDHFLLREIFLTRGSAHVSCVSCCGKSLFSTGPPGNPPALPSDRSVLAAVITVSVNTGYRPGEVPDHRQGCEHSVGSDSARPPTSSLEEVGKMGRRAGDEEENRRWSCLWDELVPRGRGAGSTQGMYYVSLAVGWEPQTGT